MTNEQKRSAEYTVIGSRPIRHDGLDKVTGNARYGADVHLPGMIHGRILRSPHAHANIRSIDTSRAEAMPSVFAVATSADFPIIAEQALDPAAGGVRMMAENDLAHKKALYKGHAVAAVAAVSAHVAEEAMGLIDVDYEPLKPVLSVHDAMKEDAPVLHEGMTTQLKAGRSGPGEDTGAAGNIASHIHMERGDIDAGFDAATLVIEREFQTQTVHQGYIEPFASTAYWAPDGHITVWTSTQGAFGIRAATATIVGVPESMVKVVPMEVGGAFGGKGIGYLDPVAAVLSKKSGRPVKIVMTRQEVFEATGPTSATYIKCKIGVDDSGTITAAKLYLAYEAGAYPGSPVGGGANTGLGPYRIENMRIDGYDVVCNKAKTQAYRAPGHPQAAFAVESVMDELAERLGMDPLELRLKNVVEEGDRAPNGVLHGRFGSAEVVEAMRSHPHYDAPLNGPNRGRGVAVGYRFNAGGGGSSATINVSADGTVNLVTGSADLSGSRVAVAMQAAEVLGISAEDVRPSVVDTDAVGFTGGSGGSRITFDTGRAAIAAAEQVIDQMRGRAALLWGAEIEDVAYRDGAFVSTGEERLTFKELAGELLQTGGPVTCSASDSQGGAGAQLAGNIVDVEVDPETGKVDIVRYTTFVDAGKAIHPSYVEGQMQGGALQGAGWALSEEYYFNEDGVMANPTFLDYRMPTSLDLPMIDTVIIEVPNPKHPHGARGVGEAPIVPPLAAIANAVHAATGVRMRRLPMSPGSVSAALQAHQETP